MSFWTMGFLHVERGKTHAACRVLPIGHDLSVPRIDAATVTAEVIELHPRGDKFLSEVFVGQPVRSLHLAMNTELPVAVLGFIP